jgi:transcription termination factor Rho
VSDQLIVEREGLEKKDKGELQAIVSALGGTTNARMRKADLIDKILELSGATSSAGSGDSDGSAGGEASAPAQGDPEADGQDATQADDADAAAEDGDTTTDATADASTDATADDEVDDDHPVGPDGEPLADWEVQVLEESGGKPAAKADRGRNSGGNGGKGRNGDGGKNQGSRGQGSKGSDGKANNGGRGSDGRGSDNKGSDNKGSDNKGSDNKGSDNRASGGKGSDNQGGEGDEDVDPNNRRSRRRSRGRGRDRDDAGNDAVSNDPVEVVGYLDLRDEGYAFLRVNGFLPSRDDAYVSVKQVRQYGLRKGDHVVGTSRPASRNEKNPALQQLTAINGKAPEELRGRPRFDKLTPLFPDERLVMECKDEPLNMTQRVIDLVAPIGKGQRGMIVSPPKAGKTSIMKNIARAIETNNPDVVLLVLLIDERPEEVTDMQRSLKNGEVVSSTFDRPPDEHTAVAELTVERAKRLVEDGKDVVVLVDGITRLARAYNMSAAQSSRVLSGGVDAAALYPPKRFLGAARNVEEGGSLTMLATALVETGSRMDEVIFEEFKGTGNMELRLDRKLAERRIFPAIDLEGSSTRNEELLRPRSEVEASWKLRKVIAGMNDEGGNAVAGMEMLIERLTSFKTNAEFLAEIARTRV